MSKNINRSRLNKANDSREYKYILLNEAYPLYWDECITTYPKYRRGYKNPNKYLMKYQVRAYRTWKHNRKTKYK